MLGVVAQTPSDNLMPTVVSVIGAAINCVNDVSLKLQVSSDVDFSPSLLVSSCNLMMLAPPSVNWWYAAAMYFERNWDASTAFSTGSSVNSGSTKSSTSP